MFQIKKQTVRKTLFLVLTLILLTNCSENSTPSGGDSTSDANIYDNKYFSFQIKIPDNWFSTDEKTMAEIGEAGKDMLAGDDKNMRAGIEAAQKNVYNLFQAFQVAPGTPGDFYNSNISCVAERVSNTPGIKSGADYLLNAKKLLQSGQMEIYFDDEIIKQTISGRDFYILSATIPVQGTNVKQKYYTTLEKGFILAFVASYVGNEQQEIIQNTMSSINFY